MLDIYVFICIVLLAFWFFVAAAVLMGGRSPYDHPADEFFLWLAGIVVIAVWPLAVTIVVIAGPIIAWQHTSWHSNKVLRKANAQERLRKQAEAGTVKVVPSAEVPYPQDKVK